MTTLQSKTMTPAVRELGEPIRPEEAFRRLTQDEEPFFLDSALRHPRLGRYSVVGARPFRTLVSRGDRVTIRDASGERTRRGNPFRALRSHLKAFKVAPHPDAPFTGGAVGYLSYDLGSFVERLPRTTIDDIGLPEMRFGFYDRAMVWDHEQGRAWLVAAPTPEDGDAEAKLDELAARLHRKPLPRDGSPASREPVRCNFARDEYLAAIRRAIDYIEAGDIFQVNVSQRLQARIDISPTELYLRLRAANPAPCAAYLGFGDSAVVSSSPELFLRAEGRDVATRPIKGTRPRGATAAEDERMKAELLASEKDAAELAMIVDLERNDLGRVCEYGTVRVPEARVIEAYQRVFHSVATVVGRLHERYDVVDLLKATFPGGSITGAPKVRAMQIIDELEPTRRSVYTGSIGWLGFDGSVNLNIAIRTFLVRGRDAFFQVGGGIVADSDPAAEYDETLHKARGLLDSLGCSTDQWMA